MEIGNAQRSTTTYSADLMTNLQSTVFEEADFRITLHVLESVKEGHTICVVISSDSDVIVTLLHHMPVYVQQGIKELCVKAGVGDNTSLFTPCANVWLHCRVRFFQLYIA